MTVFVVLICLFFFCPGFLATIAVFGITILQSVKVMNFEGGCFVPKAKTFGRCFLSLLLIATALWYTEVSKVWSQAQNRRGRKEPLVEFFQAFYTRADFFWHEIQSAISLSSDLSKFGNISVTVIILTYGL